MVGRGRAGPVGEGDAADISEPRTHRRSGGADRLRLDRPGHAAADRAALHLRSAPGPRHRAVGRASDLPRAARGALHPPRDHARELPGAARAALSRRAWILREPLGRHQLARPDAADARAGRALHRHRGRALGRALLRPVARPGRPHQLCAARGGAGGKARPSRRADGGELLRRQPRHGVVAAQGGAAAARRRPRPAGGGAARPGGLGAADAGAGGQGRAYRRARHPGRARRQAARQLRQHLVGGGVHLRELPAGRARLGQPRALVSAERPPAGPGLQGGDLSRHAGDSSPRSIPGPRRPDRSTAISSPTTRRSRSPTITPSARATRRSTARPATMPIIPATRRC